MMMQGKGVKHGFSTLLTASGFNEIGVAIYRLVQSATAQTSVCHRDWIYQGTQYIGGN